jgi:molybdopterin-guanine dinucleotide biosynthesis protein A
MGTDKALLPLRAGGPAILQIVLETLEHVAEDIFIVASDRPEYESFGVPVVPDDIAGGGALAGIHAAQGRARCESCLVVACDMPFLNLGLLERMAQVPREYDVLVPLTPGESRQRHDGLVYQTLHAIYARTCLHAIDRQLRTGNRQVVGFFPEVRVKTLDPQESSASDALLRSFFNANTPAALAMAAELASKSEAAGASDAHTSFGH